MSHPLLILSPYPQITSEGDLLDGVELQQCSACRDRCKDRVCKDYTTATDEPRYYTCPLGFSVVVAAAGDHVFRINGVLEQTSNQSNPSFKKSHRHRKLKQKAFEAWLAALRTALPKYEDAVRMAGENSISALHDIKAVIGTLLRTSEEWVWQHDGYSIDEKLENCEDELRTIYHSCRILESLLQMTDVVANPEAATFGDPTPVPVHGIVLMLKRIFEARASMRGIVIQLKGASFNRPLLFRSFIIVPLVLIDNAVKHGEKNSEVHIRMRDIGKNGVHVDVSSYGRLVDPVQRDDIFGKGRRGTNVSGHGTGLGLYVAQLVAKANGFQVRYNPEPFGSNPDRGFNHFEFTAQGVSRDR